MMKTNLPIFYKIVFMRLSGSQCCLRPASSSWAHAIPLPEVRLSFSLGIYLFTYLLDIEPKALYTPGK